MPISVGKTQFYHILAVEADYKLEGLVTKLAVSELLKAGKVAELHELYRNWDIESD